MKITSRYLMALMFITVLFSVFTALDKAASETTPALTEVDSKYVCMVTNKLFPNEQIPVEVSDKIYYGCCEMCKAQLANNPEKRMATDPVSGNTVDKSVAIIGATDSGDVYYFESKENLKSFTQN